ncbi:cytochrome oxidase subunit II [compost metagenome]
MGSVAVLLVGYVSVLWPYVVPYNMTYVEAAASRESQLIVIIGTAVMLPVVLGYNAFAYWVFRGKASNVRGE